MNRYLIEGIAKTGQGEPFVVTQKEEASDTAERFKTYIQSPVLTDIQVKFDGFYVYDVEPSVLPTLFAQRPIVLLGKWRGEPSGSVQITGKTGSSDYVQTISIDNSAAVRMVNSKLPNQKTAQINSAEMKAAADLFGVNAAAVNDRFSNNQPSKPSEVSGVNTVLDINGAVQSSAKSDNQLVLAVSMESEVLSYLWAQKRIERLTDYGLSNDNPDVKAEVTRLGLTYSMLTPYTSFIAVTEKVRNPDKTARM